jgi:hypothetical protein
MYYDINKLDKHSGALEPVLVLKLVFLKYEMRVLPIGQAGSVLYLEI